MPLLLTWINFNHSMDTKSHMRSEVWDEIAYAFPNFNLYICRYPQRKFIVLHGTFRANIFEDLLLRGSSCAETFDRMLRGTFRDDHVKNTSSAVAFHCMLRAGPTAQIVLKKFCCAGATTQKLFIVCCTGIYRESGHFFSADLYLQSTVALLNSVMTRLSYIMQHSDCWCTLRQKQNGCHFANAMLKFIFLNKKVYLFIEISMNCATKSL